MLNRIASVLCYSSMTIEGNAYLFGGKEGVAFVSPVILIGLWGGCAL